MKPGWTWLETGELRPKHPRQKCSLPWQIPAIPRRSRQYCGRRPEWPAAAVPTYAVLSWGSSDSISNRPKQGLSGLKHRRLWAKPEPALRQAEIHPKLASALGITTVPSFYRIWNRRTASAKRCNVFRFRTVAGLFLIDSPWYLTYDEFTLSSGGSYSLPLLLLLNWDP